MILSENIGYIKTKDNKIYMALLIDWVTKVVIVNTGKVDGIKMVGEVLKFDDIESISFKECKEISKALN